MTKRTKTFHMRKPKDIPKWEADVHNFLAGQIKSSTSLVLLAMIRKVIRESLEEEQRAWLRGERCHYCGRTMKYNGLTDTCGECWENG